MSEFVECCICYEKIGDKNSSVTPCGHKFCFNCITTALSRNNTCPCCREVLVEKEDDEEWSDDDEEWVDEVEEEDDSTPTIDDYTEQFIKNGYDIKDAICLLLGKYNSSDPKYSEDYMNDLEDFFENMCYDMENECEERRLFAMEDYKQ